LYRFIRNENHTIAFESMRSMTVRSARLKFCELESAVSLAKRRTAAGSARLSLRDFVPYRIAVLARGVSVSLGKKYRDLDITIPEWRLIAHLAEVGSCSSGEICARTAMDKAKVNRAVMRLVAAGLVLAGTSSRDRRVNTLKLTSRGQRIYEQIVPMALDHEKSLLDPLSETELKELVRILGKLQSQVDRLWTTSDPDE
jgi:DNA-binding MarR family transcriptional regulator